MQFRLSILFYVCMSAVLLCRYNSHAETMGIVSVHTAKVPVVAGNSVQFSMDIVFRQKPTYFWEYYDTVRQAIVIDFFGVYIHSPYDSIPMHGPFAGFSVENLQSGFSPDGKLAQLVIPIDSAWHNYRILQPQERALRILAQKKMVVKTARGSNRPYIIYVATSIAACIATFFVIWAINS